MASDSGFLKELPCEKTPNPDRGAFAVVGFSGAAATLNGEAGAVGSVVCSLALDPKANGVPALTGLAVTPSPVFFDEGGMVGTTAEMAPKVGVELKGDATAEVLTPAAGFTGSSFLSCFSTGIEAPNGVGADVTPTEENPGFAGLSAAAKAPNAGKENLSALEADAGVPNEVEPVLEVDSVSKGEPAAGALVAFSATVEPKSTEGETFAGAPDVGDAPKAADTGSLEEMSVEGAQSGAESNGFFVASTAAMEPKVIVGAGVAPKGEETGT